MKIYLVGGAVRDTLLGHPIRERDWVVVGSTPEEMLSKGFIQVGKAFPVFLHPETMEEYALARTEKKVGEGYYGFECHFSPDVTLEEDLSRRDLTINAMAVEYEHLSEIESHLIDPFGGYQDLQNKTLRHVSKAFSEDPVRLLRAARFLARFEHEGFKLAPETLSLMQHIVEMGEMDYLVPERVWQECERAFTEHSPLAFIQTLRASGALAKLFPEIDILYGIPQTVVYHPEIDTGIHVEMAVRRITELSDDPVVRFSTWVHDLGKGKTPKEQWPSHKGHEERGVPIIENLCARLKIPTAYKELAVMVSRYHLHCHRAFELRPSTILDVLMATDAFRRPERFEAFLLVCQADAQGRLGLENNPYLQKDYFLGAFKAANGVNISEVIQNAGEGAKGSVLKERIAKARVKAINEYAKFYSKNAR
jgi:tRNA nucleotidyltransferase (CCA-adding enzyme)